MEKDTADLNEGVEWIHPSTERRIRGARLTAEIHGGIPGVRLGEILGLHPIINGMTADGRNLRAYFMNGLDGPVVGISEVPVSPDSGPDL